MPRTARAVIVGCAHHVTQKGNNGRDVFFADSDREMYLSLLAKYAEQETLRVEGYCLMSNHVHIIATPLKAESLARAVGRTSFVYTQYVNRTYEYTGHLWQNRYFSCALDDAHYWTAMVYVEQNPVRAGIIRTPWQYDWSSAAVHCGIKQAPSMLDLARWQQMSTPTEWKRLMSQMQPESAVQAIRNHTYTGRPLGNERFVASAERLLGRRLHALSNGRPHGSKSSKRKYGK